MNEANVPSVLGTNPTSVDTREFTVEKVCKCSKCGGFIRYNSSLVKPQTLHWNRALKSRNWFLIRKSTLKLSEHCECGVTQLHYYLIKCWRIHTRSSLYEFSKYSKAFVKSLASLVTRTPQWRKALWMQLVGNYLGPCQLYWIRFRDSLTLDIGIKSEYKEGKKV